MGGLILSLFLRGRIYRFAHPVEPEASDWLEGRTNDHLGHFACGIQLGIGVCSLTRRGYLLVV